MCVSDFEGKGASKHLRHGQQPEGRPGIKGQPTLHPFWAAGFSFARGHFVIQVPYDQFLPMVFQGEYRRSTVVTLRFLNEFSIVVGESHISDYFSAYALPQEKKSV